MTTGEKIRHLRKQLGLTQEELGDLIGVQKAAINKYETGIVVNLKQKTISALADALHVSPVELLSPEDSPDQLSADEEQLIFNYRSLSLRGQQLLMDRAKELKLLHGKKSESDTAQSV